MRRSFSQSQAVNGYSIVEVLVVITVLGIITSLAIFNSDIEWRRERANAAAFELAGWLDSVRRQSVRGQGCDVTVTTGAALTQADTLATATARTAINPNVGTIADPNHCLSGYPARPPAAANTNFTVAATPTTTFSFTPRGTIFPVPAPDAPIEITITLNPNGPTRCVSLNGMIGLTQIGAQNGNGDCIYGGRF